MELDRILIKDLSVPGILGINPEERVNEQEILINAVLWADTRPASVAGPVAKRRLQSLRRSVPAKSCS